MRGSGLTKFVKTSEVQGSEDAINLVFYLILCESKASIGIFRKLMNFYLE